MKAHQREENRDGVERELSCPTDRTDTDKLKARVTHLEEVIDHLKAVRALIRRVNEAETTLSILRATASE